MRYSSPRVLGSLILAIAVYGNAVRANTITLTWDGTVSSVEAVGPDEADGLLDDVQIGVGQLAQFSFEFDPSAADLEPADSSDAFTYASYNFGDSGALATLSLGTKEYEIGSDINVIVDDNHPARSDVFDGILFSSSDVRQVDGIEQADATGFEFFVETRNSAGTEGFLISNALPTNDVEFDNSAISTSDQFAAFAVLFSDERIDNPAWAAFIDIDPSSFSFSSTPDSPNIPTRTVQNVISEFSLEEFGIPGTHIWQQSFDWAFSDNTLSFDVDIQLTDDVSAAYTVIEDGRYAGSTYVEVWEAGIESIWSEGAALLSEEGTGEDIQFAFNVDFVEEDADFVVSAREDQSIIPNALFWQTDLSSLNYNDDYHGAFAAHEFGHMLGLYDEYVILSGFLNRTKKYGAIDRSLTAEDRSNLCEYADGTYSGLWCDGIMGALGSQPGLFNGVPQERNYLDLLEFTGFPTDGYLLTAQVPVSGYSFVDPQPLPSNSIITFQSDDVAPVPVPPALSLLLLALGSFPLLARSGRLRSTLVL